MVLAVGIKDILSSIFKEVIFPPLIILNPPEVVLIKPDPVIGAEPELYKVPPLILILAFVLVILTALLLELVEEPSTSKVIPEFMTSMDDVLFNRSELQKLLAATVTVKAPIVTSSAAVGAAAPPQVAEALHNPDCEAVLKAANTSKAENDNRINSTI